MRAVGQAGFDESKRAQVNLFPAVAGFIYLFVGRLGDKLRGLTILSICLILVSLSANQLSSAAKIRFARINSFNLPTLTLTTPSPTANKISDEELFSPLGLVKTPSGLHKYKKRLNVFATSYDKNCSGCNETTSLGLRTGYGVVAVDPKVIPLGSRLFIPGYGAAVAGDTGGSVKGNKIDLGFDSVKNGWWSSRFVEIYILN